MKFKTKPLTHLETAFLFLLLCTAVVGAAAIIGFVLVGAFDITVHRWFDPIIYGGICIWFASAVGFLVEIVLKLLDYMDLK